MKPASRVQEYDNRKVNPRLYLLFVMIAIMAFTLTAGLAYRQLIQEETFAAAEQRQNFRRILMPGPRGNIFDRHGELLVGNRPLFSAVVYLNDLRPEFRREYLERVRRQRDLGLMPDRFTLNTEARLRVVQRYLDQINQLLDENFEVSSQDIERHFSQTLLLPFSLARDLSGEQYARLIEQIPIDSPIQIRSSTARFYPFGDLAAHTLGFVSESTDFPEGQLPGTGLLTFRHEGQIGRSGLELSFNEHLQGQTGGEVWSVDPSGFQHQRVVHEIPSKGNDLYISLDARLQQVAENALDDRTGAVAAIDIQTGEVLVLASRPSFDLNLLTPFLSFAVDQDIRERGAWINRAIQGLYPPGSTFKLITALAGLRTETIHPDTEIDCPGFHRVGQRIFHCHNRRGHGELNIIEAIRDSCNVYFYERGLLMGVHAIADEARRFRLHQRTGIELPAETGRMLIPDPAWKAGRFHGEGWFGGDTANMSIGQGFLLVTPLQMAVFTAALASGNTFIQPTILRSDNPAITGAPIDLRPDQIELVLEGMRMAGLRGTARLASSPSLPAAGKTGTAQVRVGGRPSTLAWFVGFAPVDNPRIAVAIMIEGVPESEITVAGGATAAPIARQIFQHFVQSTPSPTQTQ